MTVIDLVEPGELRRQARTDAFEEGTEDARAGRVTMLASGPTSVIALVGGVRAETVEMSSTAAGLSWTCTCMEGKGIMFCRHAVAVAADAWLRFPSR